MNLLGNIIWLVFGGLAIAVEYFIGGLVLCLAGLFLPGVGAAFGWILAWLARYVLGVVHLAAKLPFAAVYLNSAYWAMFAVALYGLVILIAVRPEAVRKWEALAAAAVCFGVCLGCAAVEYRAAEFTFTMLDVGQGDSFLVKSRGLTLLIDTGNNPRKLLAGLARHGVNRLDGVVISHADDDHCGCLADLRGVVSVDSVFVAKGLSSVGTDKVDDMLKDAERLSSASGIRELAVGDMITIGSVCFKVISPEGLTDKGENDDSICLIATTDLNDDGMGEWRALFTGDAESEVLDSLNREGALEDIDILKVGHHGAKSALDEELMDVLKPEIALISVGERNRYGHPAANTVSLLESSDVEVFRTDLQGDVVCSLSQTSISIRTMK